MSDDPREDDVAPKLRADLAALYESPVTVPARLDDAILNRARAQLARPGAPRRRRLLWAGATATAAAVACVVLVVRLSNPSQVKPLDIVDALRLAHQIQSGKGRDVNGDGRIDQRDVDAIAMSAVRLEGGVQ